jgi:hypothetical protein
MHWFLKFISEWNSTCFIHCTLSNGTCHTGLQTAFEQDQDGTAVPSCSCCLKAVCMTYTIAECTVNNCWWWTEELSETCRVSYRNKFEKLVHLFAFIIRICHDARSHERKKQVTFIYKSVVLFGIMARFLILTLYKRHTAHIHLFFNNDDVTTHSKRLQQLRLEAVGGSSWKFTRNSSSARWWFRGQWHT